MLPRCCPHEVLLMRFRSTWVPRFFIVFCSLNAAADTLTLTDGTVLRGCYVRDEGARYTVWKSLADVGAPPLVLPRSAVKEFKFDANQDRASRPARPLGDIHRGHPPARRPARRRQLRRPGSPVSGPERLQPHPQSGCG